MLYDGFLICTISILTPETRTRIDNYVKDFEVDGCKMFVPYRDNPFEKIDNIGYNIHEKNLSAMIDSDEVYIWWDKNSKENLLDLGMAFSLFKNLNIINIEDVEDNDYKSIENFISFWSMQDFYNV